MASPLLFAAGRRVFSVAAEVGGVALTIDAKDKHAAGWCERFGAFRLLDDPLKLILLLWTIQERHRAIEWRQWLNLVKLDRRLLPI